MASPSFPSAITTLIGPQVSRRIGVVTAFTGTTCTVQVAGSTFIVDGYLSSYTPVVGHTVFLLREDSSWLLLGRIIGPS